MNKLGQLGAACPKSMSRQPKRKKKKKKKSTYPCKKTVGPSSGVPACEQLSLEEHGLVGGVKKRSSSPSVEDVLPQKRERVPLYGLLQCKKNRSSSSYQALHPFAFSRENAREEETINYSKQRAGG